MTKQNMWMKTKKSLIAGYVHLHMTFRANVKNSKLRHGTGQEEKHGVSQCCDSRRNRFCIGYSQEKP